MVIFLARHGETESNRRDLILGRSDSALTPRGRRTVEDLAEVLAGQPIDRVLASSLGRAVATGRLLAQRLGRPLDLRPDMVELSCGRWEGRPRTEILAEQRLIRTDWRDRPPGGESYADAEGRVSSFIVELKSLAATEGVLIVGHAGVNHVFLKLWLNLDPLAAINILCPHEVVYLLDQGRVWRLFADGQEAEGLLEEAI